MKRGVCRMISRLLSCAIQRSQPSGHLVDDRLDEIDRGLGVGDPRHAARDIVDHAQIVRVEEDRAPRPFARPVDFADIDEGGDEEAEGAAMVGLGGEDTLAAREQAARGGERIRLVAERLIRLDDHSCRPKPVLVEDDRGFERADRVLPAAQDDAAIAYLQVRLEAVGIALERLFERRIAASASIVSSRSMTSPRAA